MKPAYHFGFRELGEDVQVFPKAEIINAHNIELGDCVKIDDFVFFASGETTRIGSFVHISPFCMIAGGGELIMEDFSGLSAGVRLHTGTDDFSGDCLVNPTVPEKYRNPIRSFVHIGKHATVLSGCTILPGVKIGEGAIIGANSLVNKDCEPWTYYVGSPARPLKPRPVGKIYEIEAQLRKDLYKDGKYIPKRYR